MYSLPTTVQVGTKEFHITNKGDFRMVLDCFSALGDEKLGEDYRVLACLLIFYEELTTYRDITANKEIVKTLIKEMYNFFNCGEHSVPGVQVHKPVINWEQDSQIICSAVNKVANTEVRSLEYLHWWTFMGYYLGIGESVLATVTNIRHKINEHKKLEKWEQEFKKNNPKYFTWNVTTVEEREAEQALRELWN